MRVHWFAINCSTGIQFSQTFGHPNFDAPCRGVDASTYFGSQRNKQFAGGTGHDEVPGFRQAAPLLFASSLYLLDGTERSGRAVFPNLAANQVRYEVTPLCETNARAERNLHLEAAQSLRIRDCLNSVEVENRLAEMYAAGDDLGGARSTVLVSQPNLSHLSKPVREIRQDLGGYLAVPAPGTQNAREG